MNFLNNIGQRNASKYLIFISILLSLVIYGLKLFGYGSSIRPPLGTIIFGTLIFSLPSILLSLTAHKSKEFRLISVFASALIVVLNAILFSLTLKAANLSEFLFIIALVQIVFSLLFLGMVLRKERLRKQFRDKNKRLKETQHTTVE